MKYINSKVETIKFDNFEIFLKRDDLLDVDFSGNKARKFYYYLVNEFPGIKKIIGYGSAQSNTLYSFSVLAKLKSWDFNFYVDHVPGFLKEDPVGNYKAALNNGAKIIPVGELKEDANVLDYIKESILPYEKKVLFVPEGGHCIEAEFGIKILADEIKEWAIKYKKSNLKVVLPSGTGTTALFLQKNLKDFEVLTCACVGGDEYLKKLFFELNPNANNHPHILKSRKKYHFGKLYKEFYLMYEDLFKQTQVEFDLLYDPLAWLCLRDYLSSFSKNNHPNILYIHQGGLLGNETMKPKYLKKYDFEDELY